MMSRLCRMTASLSLALVCVVMRGNIAAVPVFEQVMSGLANPRGLALGPEGALYVAEAGSGGSGPCANTFEGIRCYGPTGAITRLWRGEQERIVTGLPSHALQNGTSANGPNGLSFQGRGGLYVTVGLGPPAPTVARSMWGAAGPLFGTLLHVPSSGRWRVVADISDYETDVNPAGGPLDSNPFGVLAEPNHVMITDAGGNSLLRRDADGGISTVATFPSRPTRSTDAVPTAVAVGWDAAYYVSELTGGPFTPGAARIYRVVPGEQPEIFATGFTTIIDIDFGPDGNLYVLQHSMGTPAFTPPGNIIQVQPNGTRTVIVTGLTRPTSLIVDAENHLYVTNNGISPTNGEVLSVTF